MSSPLLVLSIEAAIAGGSLSLIRDGIEVISWIGTANIAMAEVLLADVDQILHASGHTVRDLGLVAVSAGPGSFTGVRIGIATALGLGTGLSIEVASETALRSMANEHPGHPELKVAVPMGRETVCFQTFDTSDGILERSEPSTSREDDFIAAIGDSIDAKYLLHSDLFNKMIGRPNVMDFGRNIALAVGRACSSEPRPQANPLFISKNRSE